MDGRLRELRADAVRRATIQDFGAEAEQVNRGILELVPTEVSALNRLAKCLMERSALPEAKSVCQRVLEIEPGNSIALRRLRELGDESRPDSPARVHPVRHRPIPVTVRPGGIDPTSESAAAKVIQGLYPDETERLTCLRRMVASIKLLGHLPSDHWETTLGERIVCLNVSKLAAIGFLPDRLRLLADKSGVPVDVWELSLRIGGPARAGLKTASNLEWIDLPSHRLDELLPRCEAAHRKAVLQASEGGRSPYLRYHSPGVVKYLNRTLGERIVGPWD